MTTRNKKTVDETENTNIEEHSTTGTDAGETFEETVSDEEAVSIYVGPTNRYISRYATYRNGYPEHLKDQLKECPLIRNMFINPRDLSEFEQNVIAIGTVENIQFGEVKKYFEKGVSK